MRISPWSVVYRPLWPGTGHAEVGVATLDATDHDQRPEKSP
jgi:hypothetical protein